MDGDYFSVGWHIPDEQGLLRMLDRIVGATTVRTESGNYLRLSSNVIVRLCFLEVCHMQSGRFRMLTGIVLIPESENPRHHRCAGV